jgi:hydroxymethylpyrimidine pyrophosphatase-like HAD family hydrolase
MRLQTFYANLVLRSKEPLRICFDLDGTLFTDPLKPGDFTTVKPLPDNIGICRQLKEHGHTIIINTGRAMGTHNGARAAWS